MTAAPSESELLSRARRGDSIAFSTLVRRHDEKMRMLAYRLLGDVHLMDDVLQDAYLRAFESLSRFRGDAAVGTWLYRIVYNRSIDELRRVRREKRIDGSRLEGIGGFEDDAVARVDLATALATLPAKQRAVVVMIDGIGLDYSAAAKAVGAPVGTVRSRLARGRSALYRALHTGDE